MNASGDKPAVALHIVFILGYPTRSRGGTEIAALAFASRLAKRGHTISAIFRHDGELVPEYQEFCDRVFVLKRRQDLPALFGHLAKLAQEKNTVIYGHHAGRIFQMVTLAGMLRARCVCHLHLPPDPMNRRGRWGLRHADRLLAVSHATGEEWRKTFNLPESLFRVMPNGTDTSRFCPGDTAAAKQSFGVPEGARVVGFVGRLDPQKGVDVLIRAFTLLRQQRPNVDARLLIAGSKLLGGDEYIQKLHQLAELSPSGSVQFVGRISDPERLLRASDVSVLPAVWPEPQPLTLLESMACGTPALGSAIGGIPEQLREDFPEHLFPANDSDALAACISKVLLWRDENPGLGARCREVALTKFGIDACVGRIENELIAVSLG